MAMFQGLTTFVRGLASLLEMRVLGFHVTSQPFSPSQNRNLKTCKEIPTVSFQEYMKLHVGDNVSKNISNYIFHEIKRNAAYQFNRVIKIKLEKDIFKI